jgi:TRAP-type C4-dicarboxylate transport system permease small subunit
MLAVTAAIFSRASHRLDQLAKAICIPTALGFIIVLLIQIFIRYVLNSSIAWSLEVMQVCFLWSIFMGVSISWKNRAHIMFHFVLDRIPDRLDLPVKLIGHGFALVFFVYVAVYGFRETVRLAPSYFAVLDISENWSQMPVPICGIIMCVHTIDQIFQEILSAADPS